MKKAKYITNEKKFKEEYDRVKSLKRELQTLIKNLKSVEKFPEEAGGIKDKLQITLDQSNIIIQKMNEYDESFEKLKSQLDDPGTGLDAIYKKSLKRAKRIQEKNKEIRPTIERINELKVDAENTLEIVTSGGLAGSFGSRAEEIFKSKRWWAGGMWVSAVLITISFFAFYLMSKDFSFNALIILRLGIVSPLIFVLGFSAKQCSKERNLLEKYEFKSVLAQSLQSYTKLLRDEFKEKEENKILEFILSSINAVYKEPYTDLGRIKKRTQNKKLSEIKKKLIGEN